MHLKVAFVIRTFDVGGSERQLLLLARSLVTRGHDVLVVVSKPGGALVPELRAADVAVSEGRGGLRALRRFRPDVVHGYLPFANVLVVAYRPLLKGARVVQGVRGVQSERDPSAAVVRAFYRVEAYSSRFAHAVIANSHAARDQAIARGFARTRVHAVPNGIDTDALRRDPVAGKQLRAKWGLADDEILVGRVADFRPTKDYGTFLEAAAVATSRRPDLKLVAVGDGPDREALRAQAGRLGLATNLIWAGRRDDIGATMSALDVMVSSSRWESFPNVVGEAMACGVPCAVTDTGDSAAIVGAAGAVAPPADPEALGTAIVELVDRLARDGQALRSEARARIEANFTVYTMVTRTEEILLGLVAT